MFTAIPLHGACGVLMGYYVGLAKFDKENNIKYMIYGLGLATILHGIYNYFLFLGYADILSIVALIIGIRYARKSINLHQDNSPFKS